MPTDTNLEGRDLESPFIDTYNPGARSELFGNGATRAWHEMESPFASFYEMETADGSDPQKELFVQVVGELHDKEFDQTIAELVQEAEALYEDRLSQEFGEHHFRETASDRLVREHFAPLIRESELLLETMETDLAQRNLSVMTEVEFESLLNQYEPVRGDLSPSFENFLKGIWKKVKKAAKGVTNVVKKGVQFAGKLASKLNPLSFVINKLKKLVRPLLTRVLSAALHKLPPALRPVAEQLAKRFLGSAVTSEFHEDREESAAFDLGRIQKEFDLQVANMLLSEESLEQEVVVSEYEAEPSQEWEDPADRLAQAREEFMDHFAQLKDGEDPRPLVENFIPAILPALKLGISLIGRPKVVNFLAGLVSKLISRFVGPALSMPLSRALVDSGLKLMSLEASEQNETAAAASTVAETVEETVRQVSVLPEYVLENEDLLEAHVQEAFEAAASANFPPSLLKPELREAGTLNGAWVLMPAGKRRKLYKKYSLTLDRNITPQMAAAIRTFGALSLTNFLRDQLGLDPTKEIRAKVHLYEAIPGTWLSRISRSERVAGLGSPSRAAWSQLHPLTPEVAGILLGEPGLGKKASDRFVQNRNFVRVGQRFYFLEVEGVRAPAPPPRPTLPTITFPARPLPPRPTPTVRESSQVYLTIDCPGNAVKVAVFISEVDAQSIATKLRQNAPVSTIMRSLIGILRMIGDAFLTSPNVRIVNETVAYEELIRGTPSAASQLFRKVAPWIARTIAELLLKWLTERLSEYFRQPKQEFIAATENAADGVTILVTFNNPPIIPLICKLARGESLSFSPGLLLQGTPGANIQVFPGLRRD